MFALVILNGLILKRYLKLLLLIILPFSIQIEMNGQSKVEELIRQNILDKDIPGFAFIVAKDGKVVEEGYYGKANVELNVPVTQESVFAIASMSKTFTAAAILLLAEEGKLGLNDPIKKYIPEAPISWDSIKIIHLLNHTAGLIDDWDLFSWDKSNELFLKAQSDSAFMNLIFEQKLLFTPGSESYYSCGPYILGIVIERITGTYYGKYLRKAIFNPLELKNTWVDNPYEIIPNRVSGYFNYDSTRMTSQFQGIGNGILLAPISYGRADVGIRTTARDLLKFYEGLLSGDLLNEHSMKIMFNPSTLNDGSLIPTAPGWMYWPVAGNIIIEHSGVFRTGFGSQALIVPKDNLVIILLSNLFRGTNFALAQKIAAEYNHDFIPKSLLPESTDQDKILTQKHFGLFKDLVELNNSSEIINANFPKSYLSKRLKKSIAETESIQFISEEDVSKRSVELFGVKIYKLRHYKLVKDENLYTTVSLDKDDKVVFIDYPEKQ